MRQVAAEEMIINRACLYLASNQVGRCFLLLEHWIPV